MARASDLMRDHRCKFGALIVPLRDRVTKPLEEMVNASETICMSLAAALLMIAQSATPMVADATSTRQGPIAASVRASVRVLRPARINSLLEMAEERDGATEDHAVQFERDSAGTVWIEFS